MKCKRCGADIEESNISGYCGYCAYKAYKENSDKTDQVKDKGDVDVVKVSPLARAKNSTSPSIKKPLITKPSFPVPTRPGVGTGILQRNPITSIPRPEIKTSITGLSQPNPLHEETQKHINAYDDEIEQLIINAFVNDRFILSKMIEEGFKADMFKNKYALRIGSVIFELYSDQSVGNIIDRMLINERLRKKNLFSDEIKNYLEGSLRHGTPKLDQVTQYVDMVKERVSREYLESVSERLSDYTDGTGDDLDKEPMDMASEVIRSLQSLQKKNQEKKVRLIREQMFQIVQAVNSRESTGEIENLGYSIKPFYDLNSALSGFRKAFMYGIAGAPRRGKTSLTLELATCVATNENIPVLFITWEQTKLNLTYRLLAKESQLNPDTLQRKRIMSNEDQEAKFALGWRKMEKYMDYFYLVEGTKKDNVDKIKAHAYNIMQTHESDDLMIVVDYIQKMPVKNDIADEKFKVEEISTQLKGLSIELNCPVIAISSLNKEGCAIDAEDSKVRPNMYHCKGSGDIEYDLDSAMILAKDWEDTRELAGQLSAKAENLGKDSVNIPKIDIVNVHIDKNRDAPEGMSNVVQFLFLIESNKFIELGYKLEADHYRFTKIENLVNKLMEDEYIVLRDLESAGSGDSPDSKQRRKKIRLRY